MLTAAEKAFEGAFDTLPGPGSRPLSLSCSLCRPCSLCADRLARSAFHLLFASSCRKLTVDVHTWPALGHSMARIDRWSTGKGMVLTACQSTISWLDCCPRVERLLWGELLSDCSLPLCSFFLWVMMGSFGFSTGQRATTVSPENWLSSHVPPDWFLTSNELSVCMCIFFETIVMSKQK